MAWSRRKAERVAGVRKIPPNSGNASNRKTFKILTLNCLGGDHDKLKVFFSTASLYMRDLNQKELIADIVTI